MTGSNNLVVSANIPMLADTITSNPQLLPLANNGGTTRTHGLASTSPAIDRGFNIQNLTFDQRFLGHPRVSGKAVDIGAFEWAKDVLFFDGYEGLPPPG